MQVLITQASTPTNPGAGGPHPSKLTPHHYLIDVNHMGAWGSQASSRAPVIAQATLLGAASPAGWSGMIIIGYADR